MSEATPGPEPRGQAPAWVPLVGLLGLVLMLLFTNWFMNTEPAPPWPDAVVGGGIQKADGAPPGDAGP